MNPQDHEYTPPPQQQSMPAPDPSPKHHMSNPLSVMQQGEQTICEVKRHPIGLFGVYAMSGALLIVMAVLAFVVVPHSASSDNRGQAITGASLLFFLIAAIVLIFVYIANKVYWGNSWIVTSDSITQMTQTSLFHRQASQLSLGNLEDVTSEKNGILANMFNFGVLRAETAGERSKFVFLFCPTPDYYAQKILAAREQFEQIHHGGKQPPAYQPAPPVQSSPQQEEQAAQPQQPQFIPQPTTGGDQAVQYAQPQTIQPPVNSAAPVEPPFYYDGMEPTNSAAAPLADQTPPAYDPGAYRPLYPDTPPSFSRSSDDSNVGQ